MTNPPTDEIERVARAIYEASPLIQYPNLDCIGDDVALPWTELHDHEKADAYKRATAAIAAMGRENEVLRAALTEACDVLDGMNDDEINVELLPRLRAALTDKPVGGK